MNLPRRTLVFTLAIFSTILVRAQDEPAMADGLRSNGKIYVVVAVILLVLFGVLAYLIRMDRQIAATERRISES
jgi:K+-transporting ATPase A subunit